MTVSTGAWLEKDGFLLEPRLSALGLKHGFTTRRLGDMKSPSKLSAAAALLGLSDPLIDSAFTAKVFERFASTDKTLIAYPAMLHEPLNDLDRALPLAAIGQWLSERLPDSG